MKDFPKWLTKDKKGAYVVDTGAAYPIVMKQLDLKHDQYALEVAYQCIKMKVQELVAASGSDPRDSGKPLIIFMESGKDKEKWAQRNASAGRGPAVATKGREARTHYERIRNHI